MKKLKEKTIVSLASFPVIPIFILVLCIGCAQENRPRERIFPVSIGDVIQQDVPIYIEAIGNVVSNQDVQVCPQVGGILEETYVEEGGYVKQGAPLFKIDPRRYQAAVDKAKATLAKDIATLQFSESQLLRNAELVKDDFISKLTYEDYVSQVEFNRGQVESDKADLATAELNLNWCVPTSPLDGRVSNFNKDIGNLIIANEPVINIKQISPINVQFSITQTDFIRVQNTQKNHRLKLEIILPQLKNSPREGTIGSIDNSIDPTTGTILIKGIVPNEDEMLWPGEFVRVRLQLSTQNKALLVPDDAVKVGQSGYYVYIYHPDSSTVEYRSIVKGPKINDLVVIEKGIKLGEKVIVKGQGNLLPGAKVSTSADTQSSKGNQA